LKLNNLINVLIIIIFTLLLLFSFYASNKGEEVKLKYLSEKDFFLLYEELSQNNFSISDLEQKEISLLLKKNEDFNYLNDSELIAFINRYKKKHKNNALKIKLYYNDEDMVLLGIYNKKNGNEYIEYSNSVGLYDEKIKMLVFFPKNLNYVNISDRQIY
jgi:hypothetical protein